jgi:hypothetical protein
MGSQVHCLFSCQSFILSTNTNLGTLKHSKYRTVKHFCAVIIDKTTINVTTSHHHFSHQNTGRFCKYQQIQYFFKVLILKAPNM